MTVQNYSWSRSLSLLFLFLALSSSVLAETSVRISDDIGSGGSIKESLSISLTNNTQETLHFRPPIGARDLHLYGNALALENGTLPIPLDCETCMVTLDYMLPDQVRSNGEQLEYARTLNLPGTPEALEYRVLLPAGYRVGALTGESPVVPTPSAFETDGKRIIVRWEQRSPRFPQRFYVSYAPPGEETFTIRSSWTELGEWPVLLFCLLTLLCGLGLGWFRWGRRSVVPLSTIPASLLTPDERAMMAVLTKRKTIMQKALSAELDWSKSKVSAIVTNLEQKELIGREKIGRNYKVTLLQDVA